MADDKKIPLCVDLDGTLVRSDLLLESFLLLIKRNPLFLFLVPFWLLAGKAHLKQQIANRVVLDAALLPYTAPLVDWLHAQLTEGRELWLCTASNLRSAQAVADHFGALGGLFRGVLASNGVVNLAGSRKSSALVENFGEKGFDYCGNARVDLAVWAHAHGAIVVNAPKALADAAALVTPVLAIFPAQKLGWRAAARALRVHQWAKNMLLLVPVAAAHRLGDAQAVWGALLALLAFSLCASSVYLLNDMLDLEADRQHHRKRNRPFAAGTLSLKFGLLGAPSLLIAALALCLLLPLKFFAVLVAYYATTMAYSFWLKRIVMVDVVILASLYTVRIVAGAAASNLPLSFWLLIFAVFIFLSLAMVKRYAELRVLKLAGKLNAKGRGYQVDDLGLLQSLGCAAGYMGMLVLALYLNSPDVARMYQQPKLVWALVPLMVYWISRVWMQTHRGNMHDDPLVFALKDRVSLAVGILVVLVLGIAS